MNARVVSRSFLLLGALAVLALSGCGQREAIDFNEKLVSANKRLASAGEAYGRAIGNAIKNGGNPADMQQVRKTLNEMKTVLKNNKDESATWKIPSKPSAKALFDAFQRFMTAEEEILEIFEGLAKTLEDTNLSPQQKTNMVQTKIFEAENREKRALAELQPAQQAFAKDYNIKLINR
jgi:hypothetical protein